MTYEHISDYEYCEEEYVVSKHSLTTFKKLNLNSLFAIFRIL